MKHFLFILGFIVSTSALADSNPFVGKFHPDPTRCNNGMQTAESIVVSVRVSPFSPSGTYVLHFQTYAQNAASQLEILLGQGSRQYPGASIKVHGVVTQEWTTLIRGNDLVSVENFERPSIQFSSMRKTVITAARQEMTITHVDQVKDRDAQITSCRLLRY